MQISLTSIIEYHWRIRIWWLFTIGFNKSNVYMILYGSPLYCDISICPYLGYFIRAYVRPLINICFLLRANTLSYILYVCNLRFLFSIRLFLPITFWLCRLIASPCTMNEVFNIMSLPKTSWPGVDCSIVRYVLHTAKYVAANIPDQGSSLSR